MKVNILLLAFGAMLVLATLGEAKKSKEVEVDVKQGEDQELVS